MQINNQHNTPTTNGRGETRRGKIIRGLVQGHSSDDTSGVDTLQGCVKHRNHAEEEEHE